MTTIKRIFITGGNGTMWSGTDRHLRIHCLPHIDNSDMNTDRIFKGHYGPFWNTTEDPGWEWVEGFNKYSRDEIIEKFDSVYDPIPESTDFIIRTYKSHIFLDNLDRIEELFPDADIILTNNIPFKAILWWLENGGNDTVLNNYDIYKRDVELVWAGLLKQHEIMNNWVSKHNLPGGTLSTEWLTDHFGPQSKFASRVINEYPFNKDTPGSYYGHLSFFKNISNTARIYIKHGTERRIP